MAMPAISKSAILKYRRRVLRGHRVASRRGALRFIDSLGFCFAFTGGPGGIPGLFDVLATRSVDRMWSWAWRWKDELASARLVHYGKVIRRKPSYVSLEMLPAFYALSDNLGEPDDHLQAYRSGRLSLLAKDLCERILAGGPVSTWALRRLFVRRGESGSRFHRALDDLQGRFLVAKVAEVEGRGGYSFIWDAFHRWMPSAVEAAREMGSTEAAARVLKRYLEVVGAATDAEIAATFGWAPRLLETAATGAGAIRATLGARTAWASPRLCPPRA